MTGWQTITYGVLAGAIGIGSAFAQTVGSGPNDPCSPTYPQRNFVGALFGGMTVQQREQACLAERKAQWDQYYAQQRQNRDDQEARERQAALAAEQERVAEQARERERLHVHQVFYDNMVAQENSPNNLCKVPDTARILINQWNDFDRAKEMGVKVIDIKHLITLPNAQESDILTCHGVLVTTTGDSLIGTIEMRKNVADDVLFTWHADFPQDLSLYEVPPAPMPVAEIKPTLPVAALPAAPVAAMPVTAVPASFSAGLVDRQRWEGWVGTLTGDEKDGAVWWATYRNGPKHVSCVDGGKTDDAEWSAGCLNAQKMLTGFDLRRRSDADYKRGWNSF